MKGNRHPAYRAYFWCIAGAGLMLFALSVLGMARQGTSVYWVVLAFLTAAISALAIKIPGIESKISIEDTLFFTNLILFGPQAGVLTAALQGLTGSILAKSARKRLEYALFNIGALTLSAYMSGRTFFGLLGREPLLTGPAIHWGELALPTCAMALVYYLCNSSTVATIIALDARKKVYRVWAQNFRWTCLSYFTEASVAALVAVNLRSGNLGAMAVLVPMMLIIFFVYKTYKEKVEGQIQSLRELSNLYLRMVESLALAVDAKDQATYGHIRRVRAYALGLARLCEITDKNELLAIDTGSLLHDVGKLAVDDRILNKPGRLSPEEFEAMKLHTIAGEEIVNQIQFPFPVATIVRGHHERWDGKGYPDGLRGEEIPLGARILMIADTFDALRTPRSYKSARSIEESTRELRAGMGSMYDPALTGLFLKNIDQLEAEAAEAVKNMPKMAFRYSGAPDPGALTAAPAGSAPALPKALKSCEELVSLYEFCIGTARQLSLSDFLMNLECRLRRLVPFDSWAFFLKSGDNTLQVAHSGGRIAEQLQNLRIHMGGGVSGWAAANGRPMISSNAPLEFESLPGDFRAIAGAVVIPVSKDEICLGTISLYSEASTTYTNDHLEILKVLSTMVAPVIQALQQNAPAAKDFLDPVTKAYPASYLAYAGPQMIASCQSGPSCFSLAYMDLCNLDEIVTLSGPEAGNRVLRQVAEALRAEIREADTLIRFGPRAFVILLADVRKGQIANRIRRFRPQFPGNGSAVPAVACASAIACYPEDGRTIFALLDSARHALEAQVRPQQIPRISKLVEFPSAG